MNIERKVIWITGASSGIGEALAYEFNKKGARLILSARRTEELERVKNNCTDHEEHVRILPLDLSETDLMQQKTETATELFGSIDMLINNGGISQRATAADTNMEIIRKIMEVNFFGTIALTKAVLPGMIAKKSGHIVTISSVMGKFGTKHRSAYAASKHALQGWFDSLRQEMYEHNVEVTIVCPGYVQTNITVHALTADGDTYNKMGEGQKNAMSPGEFAQKLIPKLARGKEEVYIGGAEILAIYLKRLSPVLLNKVLRKMKVT